jgi:hypothetical protein
VINRQRITGWILVAVAGGYLVYFLKTRLLTAGLPIEKKEWLQFAGMLVCLMLGTINVRLAAMREQKRKLEQSNKKSA